MPISSSGQGYSGNTKKKVKTFGEFLKWHCNIVSGIEWKPKYHYIDMTAGDGTNHKDGTDGCAVVANRVLESSNLIYDLTYIEIEGVALNRLKSLVESPNSRFINGDYNEELLPACRAINPFSGIGMVYFDPNSPGVKDGNIEHLATITDLFSLSRYRKIDFLMHYPTTSLKRIVKSNGNCRTRFIDYVLKINKKDWWITEPSNDGQGWTFLMGSNYKFNDFRKAGIFNLNSKQGQSWLDRANLTGKERQQSVSYEQKPFGFLEEM